MTGCQDQSGSLKRHPTRCLEAFTSAFGVVAVLSHLGMERRLTLTAPGGSPGGCKFQDDQCHGDHRAPREDHRAFSLGWDNPVEVPRRGVSNPTPRSTGDPGSAP